MAGGKGKGIQIVVGTDYNDRDLKRAQRDLDNLKRQAAATATPMQKLGSTMRSMVGPAFAMAAAAAGALAIKFAVDGVKAAAAEELALTKLKTALDNVGQGFAETQVNAFIDDLQRATGVADDQLRPAFQTLVTATKDAAQAQDLLALALDISVGTGKDLQSVTLALAKASNGQTTALRRLGVPLSDAAVKSGNLVAVTSELREAFGGQAQAAAKTFEGQLKRLGVAFDELQESFGKGFFAGLGETASGTDDLAQSIKDLEPAFEMLGKSIGESVRALGDIVAGMKDVKEQYNLPSGPSWFNDLLGYTLGLPGLLKTAAAAVGLFGGDADRTGRSAQEMTDSFTDSGKGAAILAELVENEARPAVYRLGDAAASSTTEMSLLRAEIRRTTIRLGFLTTAFDEANAAMDRRESMRSYQDALKTFIADPSAETRDAAVAAAMDVAESFEDPKQQARFTGQAVDEITAAAKRAGVNVPPDLVKIGDAARNQLDPVASLKRDLESIDNDILVDIKVRTTYIGTPPPGGYPTGDTTRGSAYGGFVGGHGGSRADDVPAMLSSGEFVIQAPAVSQFGRGFFAALNQGVNPLAGMTPSVGGSGGGLTINGGITVQSAPGEAAAVSLPRALRRAAFLAGVNG